MLEHPLAGVIVGAVVAFALARLYTWWSRRRAQAISDALAANRLRELSDDVRALRETLQELDRRLVGVDRSHLQDIVERLVHIEATVGHLLEFTDRTTPRGGRRR